MTRGSFLRIQRRWRPGASVAVLAASLVSSACRPIDDETARFLSEPTERHAIGFAKRTTHLHVEAGPDRLGMSANQRADVASFVQTYREQGVGPLRVSLPMSARGRLVAGEAAREVRAVADELGIAQERIVTSRHRPGGAEPAAVIVSFTRPVAMAPVCGDWSEDIGRDLERIRYPQFGCATQRNIALNVANARDLVQPQEETPSSSERRFVAWTKYVGTPSAPGGGGDAGSSATPDKKPPKNPTAPPPTK